MTIQEIKAKIAADQGIEVPSLQFVQQRAPKDADGNPGALQPWASHWDNDNRVRVVIPMDVLTQLMKTPTDNKLAIKHEVVEATEEREAYTRYVIITPKDIVAVF